MSINENLVFICFKLSEFTKFSKNPTLSFPPYPLPALLPPPILWLWSLVFLAPPPSPLEPYVSLFPDFLMTSHTQYTPTHRRTKTTNESGATAATDQSRGARNPGTRENAPGAVDGPSVHPSVRGPSHEHDFHASGTHTRPSLYCWSLVPTRPYTKIQREDYYNILILNIFIYNIIYLYTYIW